MSRNVRATQKMRVMMIAQRKQKNGAVLIEFWQQVNHIILQ